MGRAYAEYLNGKILHGGERFCSLDKRIWPEKALL